MGKSVGQFVAELSMSTAKGNCLTCSLSLLTNTLGIFFIVGIFFFFDNLSDFRDSKEALIGFIVSFVLMAIPVRISSLREVQK